MTEQAMIPTRDEPHYKRLAVWLASQLGKAPEGSLRSIQRIMCVVSASVGRAGLRGDPVGTWHRDDGADLFDPKNVHELASQIWTAAEGVATSPGDHRFSIAAIDRCDGKTFTTIVIAGEAPEAEPMDAPSALLAQLAQTQRHLEATQAMFMRGQAAIVDTLSEQLTSVNEELKAMRLERQAHLKELEEARDQTVRREIEAAEAAGREKRKDDALGKLLTLAPVVANRIAGEQILPTKDPRQEMLASLSKSLSSDPSRLQRLAAHLTQEEVIMLLELMRSAAPPAESNAQPPNGVNAS